MTVEPGSAGMVAFRTPMKLNIDRPIAFLDIESTGANCRSDRLIDLAIIKLWPDGKREEYVYRVNPGIPIPPESTQIHGIRDADVKDAPLFAAVVEDIDDLLRDSDLGGYNLLRFDIPLLEEEFRRVNRVFNMAGRRVVDVQRIFHKREPRDLSAALLFYCGERHEGAHGALADTDATIRVLEGQFERYADLPRDPAALDAYVNPPNPAFVDREGRLIWDAEGEVVVNFGKAKGRRLRDLARFEPSYLEWMMRKGFAAEVLQIVGEAQQGRFPVRPPAPPAPPPTGE